MSACPGTSLGRQLALDIPDLSLHLVKAGTDRDEAALHIRAQLRDLPLETGQVTETHLPG